MDGWIALLEDAVKHLYKFGNFFFFFFTSLGIYINGQIKTDRYFLTCNLNLNSSR